MKVVHALYRFMFLGKGMNIIARIPKSMAKKIQYIQEVYYQIIKMSSYHLVLITLPPHLKVFMFYVKAFKINLNKDQRFSIARACVVSLLQIS